jgi:ferric-dicitrate binding protein FerR (iron transport regulator)
VVDPSDSSTTASSKHTGSTDRSSSLRVEQGEEITYGGENSRVASVERVDSPALEWMTRRLQYRDVPLRYVVADVNRYRNHKIVIQGREAEEYEFTGTVFLDRIPEWASSLEIIFPVQVRQDDAHIVIQCRPPRSPAGTCKMK